jgi:hypothetical protein
MNLLRPASFPGRPGLDFLERSIQTALHHAIGDSSAVSYGTGYRHWIRFCLDNHLPIDGSGEVSLHKMCEFYVAYLLDLVRVTSNSASSYVSHVIHHLYVDGVIETAAELRTPRVKRILAGFERLAPKIPLRERVRIPCTVNIAITALATIPSVTSDPLMAEALEASLAAGYGISLRPQEYLLTKRPVLLSHQANSSLAFFWFRRVPYSVTRPDLYPPGEWPEAFSLFLDFNKNNQTGQGGPRSVWCSPFDDGFCVVGTLFRFLKKYPPPPSSPLLSGIGFRVTSADITRLFDATAAVLGLPAGRLLPHSLRSGAIAQMVAAQIPVDLLQGQGDWHSIAGLRSYAHTSLEQARKKTGAIHDVSLIPVAQSIHQYSRHG